MAVNMTAQTIAVKQNWVKSGDSYVGDQPDGISFTPLREISFDGLSNGQTDAGFDWYLGNTAFANGYGTQAQTVETFNGASSALELSIAQGSDGDPAGGDTGASYGAFGGGLSLGTDKLVQGEEIWVGFRIKIPTGFDWQSNNGGIKFLRMQEQGAAFIDTYVVVDGSGNQTGWSLENENDPMAQSETRKTTRDLLDEDTWHWFEVQLKPHSDGLLSERRLWLDGVLQFERVGRNQKWLHTDGSYLTDTLTETDGDNTLTSAASEITEILLFTYWNGYAPQNQELYIQNIIYHKDRGSLPASDAFSNPMIGGS